MSKIANDGLTRSGTGCFIAVPNSGRQRVNLRFVVFLQPVAVNFKLQKGSQIKNAAAMVNTLWAPGDNASSTTLSSVGELTGWVGFKRTRFGFFVQQ